MVQEVSRDTGNLVKLDISLCPENVYPSKVAKEGHGMKGDQIK